MKRVVPVFAMALLMLAGCSSHPVTPSPSQTEQIQTEPAEEPTAAATTTEAAEATAEATSSNPASSSAATSAPTGAGAPEPKPTAIRHIWPDSSWDIRTGEISPDECQAADMASQFTDRPDFFTCGSNAASLLACHSLQEGGAMCIQNADGKVAAKLDNPGLTEYHGEPVTGPIPFRAGLSTGEVCSAVSHDHGTHYNGMFSWFTCSGGAELLVGADSDISETFASSAPVWSVQKSTGKQAPKKTAVAWVEYAGMS